MTAKPPPPPRASGNGTSRLGGQSAGKSRPFAPPIDREWYAAGEPESARPSLFTIFSHEYSIEADRQTVRSARTRSLPTFNLGAQIFSVRGRRQSGPNPITFFAFFPSSRAQNDRESLLSLSILPRICHF